MAVRYHHSRGAYPHSAPDSARLADDYGSPQSTGRADNLRGRLGGSDARCVYNPGALAGGRTHRSCPAQGRGAVSGAGSRRLRNFACYSAPAPCSRRNEVLLASREETCARALAKGTSPMNAPVERYEKFFRAWAETTCAFDKDRGRDHFLSAHRAGKATGAHVVREMAWLAAAAMVAAAAIALWLRPPESLAFMTPGGQGQVGSWLATHAASELPLALSDNTPLVLRQDSRGRGEQVIRRGASFLP